MRDFQVGDVVECIYDTGMRYIHNGDKYTVIRVSADYLYLDGLEYNYSKNKFRLCSTDKGEI